MFGDLKKSSINSGIIHGDVLLDSLGFSGCYEGSCDDQKAKHVG
jgi:hypothetical protein